MAKLTTLHALFVNKLKMLLDMEMEIIEELPIMAENATDGELKAVFEEHLVRTRNQAERLKAQLEGLGEDAKALEAEAIRGLNEDAEWLIDNAEKGPILDAALLSAAQSVEHYEAASYGSAINWAETLEHSDAANALRAILQEERDAIEKLNDLAMSQVNARADAE